MGMINIDGVLIDVCKIYEDGINNGKLTTKDYSMAFDVAELAYASAEKNGLDPNKAYILGFVCNLFRFYKTIVFDNLIYEIFYNYNIEDLYDELMYILRDKENETDEEYLSIWMNNRKEKKYAFVVRCAWFSINVNSSLIFDI